MVKKTYTPEQIINKLREAEVLLSQGATIRHQFVCYERGSPHQTQRWGISIKQVCPTSDVML